MALGLGEMQMESFLNQPLKASVDLLNMEGLHGDEVRVRLATTEDFDKLGLERAYFLTSVTFEVVPDGRGGAQILLRSEDPVLEPYLDFVIEARWPSGRLLREYTVLVDPPTFSRATPVVSASERVAATEGIAAPVANSEQFASRQTTDSSNFDYNQAVESARQRDNSAPSRGSIAPGSQYRISQNQTLWEIASMAKSPGASVHQTMLDIQRINPDAFINGNINRIKAGYIIYLPGADDISSADLPSALAAVREQNQAWREGRDAASAASRPSLRIAAEPEESVAADTAPRAGVSEAPAAASESEQPRGSAIAAAAGRVSSETLERLAALEEQLQTLQRIVSLKDDQIAALQDALKEADGGVAESIPDGLAGVGVAPERLPPSEETAFETEASPVATDQAEASTAESGQVAEVAPAQNTEAAEAPPAAKSPAPPPSVTADDSWTSYLLYILGALVLAVAAYLFSRRRAAEAEDDAPLIEPTAAVPAPQEDVFADVHLQDHNLEVVPASKKPAVVAARAPLSSDSRGYGERKHDEYASDVDAADALAEADIYVAYGRHPQAIDLLSNALTGEPSNPVYRIKLLEIYTELKDRVAATAQLKHIIAIGDADSIARAESIIDCLGRDDEPEQEMLVEIIQPAARRGPGLAPNPLEILSESNESLEEDFSGLEIEEGDGSMDSDLDLSADFGLAGADPDDEDLVIAADSNALSTKLDLARAYLDMGDDEGARQILDEVVAEGTDDLKSEARTLLSRIG